MKKRILIILLFYSTFCLAQEQEVKTEIKAENVFELSIIQVYPDSFPIVSVVFQAKNEFGKPLWTLNKSEIEITENENECEVLRLKNISKNKPLNIGIIFDHSGSMVDNPTQIPKGKETMQDYYLAGLPLPNGYIMAIEYAKKGVLNFLIETEFSKDSILFIGFSGTVDKVYPLTNNFKRIKSFVNKVEPSGRTAFFDALYLGIDSLSNYSSKGVIVALTDGQDDSSKYKFHDVIEYANLQNISIYIIGLGNVNEIILKEISKRTNGFYYHTNEPEKLEEIYLNIKEQIKSIYEVDYTSYSQDYLEKDRQIKFHFVNDTLEFSNNSNFYSLSGETIEYLKKQEATRLTKLRNRNIIGGFGILLLGIGGFLIYKRRRKNGLIISTIYPNPFHDELNIDFKLIGEDIQHILTIFSINGQIIKTLHVNERANSININLEYLEQGTYILQLSNSKTVSNTIKAIKK